MRISALILFVLLVMILLFSVLISGVHAVALPMSLSVIQRKNKGVKILEW